MAALLAPGGAPSKVLPVFVHRVAVRWNDVDAAALVYFPLFLDYCHQALEALFGQLPGGYPELTQRRGLGVPTVHLEADFLSPLRYGDACLVRLEVLRLGRSSIQLRHTLTREADGAECARVRQVVALSELAGPRAVALPPEVRALLEAHLVTEAPAEGSPS